MLYYIFQIGHEKEKPYIFGNVKNTGMRVIVSLIIKKGYIEILKYIIENRSDILENRSDILENVDSGYLFRCAMFKCQLEIVKYLEGKYTYSDEEYKPVFDTIINYKEGMRYIVVLKYLLDKGGNIGENRIGNQNSYYTYIVSTTLYNGHVKRIKRIYEESEDKESMNDVIFEWIEKYIDKYELRVLVHTKEYESRDINAVISWAVKTGKVDWKEWEDYE